MLVRDFMEERLTARPQAAEPPDVALPKSLRRAGEPVRTQILVKLAANRRFALGDRSGAAGRRPMHIDASQRVVVKALVSRRFGRSAGAGVLGRHVAYLGRAGAGEDSARPTFFSRDEDGLSAAQAIRDWRQDRHHFRLIISPEHGDRIADLPDYVRDVMARTAKDLHEPQLAWIATCHFDTDQPHAHVLVRGRRADGRDLVMPRAVISHGIRIHAQAAAQERLGDLSRQAAEQRLWRQTKAARFTQLDRQLVADADEHGLVADGVGRTDAWSALSRGRLRHLEQIGLAQRVGARYRLSPSLEKHLRQAQLRMDVIRTLNQRQLEIGRSVSIQSAGRIVGEVARSGHHDEIGAVSYAIVRDRAGAEHYATLGPGTRPPDRGAQVVMEVSPKGVKLTVLGAARDLGTSL